MANSDLEEICPEPHEQAILRELLIRAHVDPDFRFELIWDPEETLGRFPETIQKALKDISFSESTSNLTQEIEFDGSGKCIRLMLPAWQDGFGRRELEAMIDSAKKE